LIGLRRHAIPLLFFAGITAFWFLPLLSHLSTLLPGANGGDNDTFVWNLWWMRYVLHHQGQSFFFTPLLFHPFGADLTLHTHTALPAIVAAVAGPSSVIASQNLLIVLHVFLNFACSYALAYRTTRRVTAAIAGSAIFGTSCFVSAHLPGHFNLIAAWTVPLVCLLADVARERRFVIPAMAAGLALGATAYTDYYLFVFAAGVLLVCWIVRSVQVLPRQRAKSNVPRRLLAGLAVLGAIDLLVIVFVLFWPVDRIDVGPIRISVRSISNPVTALWILGMFALGVALWQRIDSRWRRADSMDIRVAIALVGTTTVLLLPLLVHATRMWIEGRYVSQTYFWRSAPAGVDLATLVLGSPYHALWGEAVSRLYTAWHIDVVERCGWIPISALILAAAAVAGRFGDAVVRQWSVAGAVFMTWALGPWLTMFGHQTPLILPATLVRFLPIVANARIPGRAMVVAYLALAMLSSLGLARLIERPSLRRRAAGCLAALLAIECIPARPPLDTPDMPSQYAMLRTRDRRGALCELPLGLRDGFGETGSFDASVLLHQTLHERPIIGGFLARLPTSVARDYGAMPVIGSLLRLSAGGRLSDEHGVLAPREAASALTAAGIAFVVLDTRRASPELIQYVQSAIALRNIGEEDGRIFYEVF
jgi:hypothetical protein